MLLLACAWLAGASSVGELSAQGSPIRPGDRVRVTLLGDGTIVGDVGRIDGGALFLDGDPPGGRRVAFDEIARIERRLGRQSYIGRGALIGGGIAFAGGGAFGALLVHAICEEPSGCGEDTIPAILLFGGIAGAGGALAGALIGAAASHDVWEDARVDGPAGAGAPGLRLGLFPAGGGGPGVGLRWTPG